MTNARYAVDAPARPSFLPPIFQLAGEKPGVVQDFYSKFVYDRTNDLLQSRCLNTRGGVALNKPGLYAHTFQHPNAYVDQLAYFLTPEEEKVLNRLCREILGFAAHAAERVASVSISVLVDGKISVRTGERLAYGCGLSEYAVRKALRALIRFGVIERAGSSTQAGQPYRLPLDSDAVDWAALKARRALRDARNARRGRRLLAAQRAAAGAPVGDARTEGAPAGPQEDMDVHTGVGVRQCGGAGAGVGVQQGRGVGVQQATDVGPQQPKNPVETQRETQVETQSSETPGGVSELPWAAAAPPPPPTPPPWLPRLFEMPVREIKAQRLKRAQWREILEAEQARGPTARRTLTGWLERKLGVNQHPAIRAYFEVVGYYPPKAWRKRIAARVSAYGAGAAAGAAFWKEVVTAYIGCGWSPNAVQTMLEYFERGEVPRTRPQGRPRRRAATGLDAVAAYAKLMGYMADTEDDEEVIDVEGREV